MRIWVPGCSTGEEAYSLGIILLECMRERSVSFPVKIFATDISNPSLDKARTGIYADTIVPDCRPRFYGGISPRSNLATR